MTQRSHDMRRTPCLDSWGLLNVKVESTKLGGRQARSTRLRARLSRQRQVAECVLDEVNCALDAWLLKVDGTEIQLEGASGEEKLIWRREVEFPKAVHC